MEDVKPGGVLEPPGRNNMALKKLLSVMRQRDNENICERGPRCGGLSNRQRQEFEAGSFGSCACIRTCACAWACRHSMID